MGRRKSLRHYTLFEANSAADPTDSLESTHQDGSPRRPSSPDEVLRPTKRRRAMNGPSSPMSPSSRSNDPLHELSALPADILLRIAEFLEPVVSPFDPKTGGGPSPSASWLDPGLDVMSFSATCRAIWLAVREVVGRRLVLRVDSFTSTGLGLAARLSSVIGEKEMDRLSARGEGAPRENTSVEDYLVSIGRTNISEEEKEEFVSRFRRSTHRIQSGRIRHLIIHTESPAALQHMDDIIARDMELMPRLETCSVVYMTEFDVIASSPYAVATLGATVLASLTRRPRLRELYLCGVRIDHGMVPALAELDCPTFPQLKSLTINAAHDSALQIANLAPALKEVKLWRDFARSARIHATGWWSEDLWRTLEHVELRGFSGSQGRPLHDDWKSSLKTLRTDSPSLDIPVKSIRLCEAYQLTHFITDVLPFFAGLPHLTSFTCMVWRDRHWSPAFLGHISTHLPNLTELTVGVENSGLNWWPGNISDYGLQLAAFPRLSTFTWNYTMYSEIDFEEARKTLYAPSIQLAARCPTLRQIRWLDETVYLVRPSSTGKWRWSDELALEKAHRAASPLEILPKAMDPMETAMEENKPPKIKSRRSLFGTTAGLVGGAGSSKSAGVRRMMGDWEDAPAEDSGFFEGSDE